ncbi:MULTISPECIES: L-threonylcarbamoyladenylate synthase [Prochlorococcus]|uniref:L-threonylcarbamoyladenylate synthase n=1 Tax=Prochlorococcus TaxID=1218 RepID=UPI00053372AD|nr:MULTISPECIES: L-threonylcarbamoyladenylate synthase [Prochlorococcus]KGG13036.1 hypothetical protein EV05_0710 [Prochlorococcus sp. MIT 0601]
MKSSFLSIPKLVDQLNQGSPVVFPTDTMPALATLPKFAYQMWEIKGRPKSKPLILMGSSSEDLFNFVNEVALKDALSIAQKYWPGALTMVLPSSSELVHELNPGGVSIGMRVPDCDLAKHLLSQSGPLATSSANLSGQEPLLLSEEVAAKFPRFPLLAPTPWPKPSGLASTVISWQGPGNWHLIRKGAVIPEVIGK